LWLYDKRHRRGLLTPAAEHASTVCHCAALRWPEPSRE